MNNNKVVVRLLDINEESLDKILTKISKTTDENTLKKLYRNLNDIKTIWKTLRDEELRLIEEGQDSDRLIRMCRREIRILTSN